MTITFEEAKLQTISNLAIIEKNELTTLLIGEIKGYLRCLEKMQQLGGKCKWII